jgi:hypothetical protein
VDHQLDGWRPDPFIVIGHRHWPWPSVGRFAEATVLVRDECRMGAPSRTTTATGRTLIRRTSRSEVTPQWTE